MLYYSLILIFYLLFTYLTLRQVRFGIYLILLFLPSYLVRYQIFGVPATLLEGMIWLLFIVWLIKSHKEKGLTFNPLKWVKNIVCPQSSVINPQNPVPQAFRLPIILFLAVATISVFTSPNFQPALGIWKAYFVEALMFFVVFVYNIITLEHLKHVIRILGILTIAIGLFAIYQKLTGAFIPNPLWAEETTRRITTFFGYPNANALLVAPIILLTIGNLLTDILSSTFDPKPLTLDLRPLTISFKSWINQSFNLLVVILGVLTILWTKSLGALIGLTVGLIVWLILYKKTRLVTLIIGLLVSASLFFIPTVNQKIQNAYIAINEIHLSDKPSDIQLRTQQWRETLTLLKDTPIFGAGLAGYQTLIAPYHINKHIEIFLYPHNFFLNFWVETGLFGLIGIVWVIISFFIIGYKSLVLNPFVFAQGKHQSSIIKNSQKNLDSRLEIRDTRTLTLSVICAMITFLVHGLVDVPYFKNDLSILFWVIVGLVIILYNQWRGARAAESDGPENR